MIRKIALALAALALSACAAPAPPDQPVAETFIGIDGRPLVSSEGVIDNAVQEALTANPDACAMAGGSLQPVCRMQKPMCLIAFKDAGAECSDGAQCGSGRCLAKDGPPAGAGPAKGQCAATNDPCGCYTRIEDGAAQATIRVD